MIELGDPHISLVKVLRAASAVSRCKVMGFHEMTAEEISLRSQMPIEEAILAKQREYDEPFEILDADRADRLLHAIEEQGKHWTRGGRFYHILGNNDKAVAVQRLTELYRLAYTPTQYSYLPATWNLARKDSATTFDIVEPESSATLFKTE